MENDITYEGPVTRDMKTSEMLEKYPVAMEVFNEYGMLCMGCACSSEETVGESCSVHCMDPDQVISYLNRRINESEQKN